MAQPLSSRQGTPQWLTLLLTLTCLHTDAEELARSPASDTPRPGVVRPALPLYQSEGLPLALVFFDLKGTSGITGGDAEARRQMGKALGLSEGSLFTVQTTEVAMQRLRGGEEDHAQREDHPEDGDQGRTALE